MRLSFRVRHFVLIAVFAFSAALLLTSSLEAADCGKTCTPAYTAWPTGCGANHAEPCHGQTWQIVYDGSCSGTSPGCKLGKSAYSIQARGCSKPEGGSECVFGTVTLATKVVDIKNC